MLDFLFGTKQAQQTSQTQVQLPEYMEKAAESLVATAGDVAKEGFVPYTGPRLAVMSQAEKDAIARAQAQTGIAGTQAGQAFTAATAAGAPIGQADLQRYMDPYMTNVADIAAREARRQSAIEQQGIAAQSAQAGAFGGGKQGALEGQYMADTALGRAGITAQLNQQAFQDATSRRGQALQDQFALSNFQRAGTAGDVASLGNLGAFRQGLNQQQLQAQADAARTAAYEPQQRLQQYGGGLGQLAGFASPAPAPMGGASPFATGLSTATGIAGLFGKLYG